VRQGNATVVGFTVKGYYKDPVFDARNTNLTAKVPNIVTTPSVTGNPTLFNGTTPSGGQ